MKRIFYNQIVCMILGMIGGFFILHPYTMLVYALMHGHEAEGMYFHWKELNLQAIMAFEPIMLPMGIAFVVFGGLMGLLTGALIKRKKKLIETEYENEKKKIAMKTMHGLMVTLSHHLLNANMIIGGKVRHSRKIAKNKEVQASLEVIEEQGRKIDAVIESLREATEMKMADYTSNGEVKMIDIERDIEDRLRQR